MAETDMSTGSDAPTREENTRQLARILASRTLEKHQKLRELLERLVNDHLAGKPVNEDMLGREVFGKPKDWIPMDETVVREGMRNLRKRLKLYCRAEGHDDEVIITFPPRTGYAPRFSYNPSRNAEESVRRIAEHFSHRFPDVMHCGGIVRELEACIAKHPSYAPAYVVLAEVMLACAMCDETYAFAVPQAIVRAEEAVKTGLELHEEVWRMHGLPTSIRAGGLHRRTNYQFRIIDLHIDSPGGSADALHYLVHALDPWRRGEGRVLRTFGVNEVASAAALLLSFGTVGRCLKAKFFEFAFERPNKVRPFFYVVDEAHRFLTAGAQDGEQSLLDRCRAYRTGVVLATQSIASMMQRLEQSAGGSKSALHMILNNCGNALYFRTPDIQTQDNLQQRIPGPPVPDRPHVIKVRPLTSLGVGNCYALRCNGSWGLFQVHLPSGYAQSASRPEPSAPLQS